MILEVRMKIHVCTDNGILIEKFEHVEEHKLDMPFPRAFFMDDIKEAIERGIRYAKENDDK